MVSGYSGGDKENPTYEQVSTGRTGHMEAVQIEYDPSQVNYKDLLEVFWTSHNPIQKGGQGADTGSQYEAAILYHNDEQKVLAEESKASLRVGEARREKNAKRSANKALEDQKIYDKPIATKIMPFKNFYPAEDYHQDYYGKNPEARYCQIVINPKVEKIRKLFHDKLK
ncbi:MAG: peptide-methionine (S)-S-oxide reductase [Parcubacteria group bacterium Gr01-1014_30]|nr:MAG: peptide-methionine (S)-S-oxide reductase [Parcubacteria group bacterium Gr01-1014_30]